MRRLLFVLASIIAVLTFSCDTTQPDFDDSVPDVNTLTTSVSPEEGGEILPADGEFVEGTSLEIEAVPNPGYMFDRWEGDLVGSLNPTFLSMTANRSVTAFFSEVEVPLTINVVGEGSVLQEIIVQEQEQVAAVVTTTLEAEEPLDTLSVNADGSIQILQRDRNHTVDGTESNPVRVRPSLPDGRIEQTEIPQQQVTAGSQKAITTLQLTAVPEDGWLFARWEGDLTGSQNPDTLVVEEETVVTAVFELDASNLFTLALTVQGQGFIEAVPDKTEFTAGEEVTLTATPEEGWRFSGWQGDLDGSENPETLIMDADKEVTSVFSMIGAPVIEILQQPTGIIAGNEINPAPAIQISNDQGEPLEGVNVNVRLNQNEFTSSSGEGAITDEDGIARFNNLVIESASAGYRIIFEADDPDIASVNSSEFIVQPAEADPSFTEAVVPGGVAGGRTEILISVFDRYNNPISNAEDQLSVSVSGDNSASPSVSAGDEIGQYLAEYTPQNAGTDEVAIELNGNPIDGSPFTSDVITSDISSSESSVTADPIQLQAGNSSVVTIELRDASGNNIGGLSDSDFSINVSGSGTAGSVSETSVTGDYRFNVSNTEAEQISVTVNASGVTLEDAPQITFTAAEPDLLAVPSGSQPGNSVAGQAIANSPTVRLIDEFGNTVPGIEVTVTEQNGQEFASGTETVTTNSSGLAVFDDLVINQAGRYNLFFTAANLTATSNAFNVNPADADASETTATVPNGSAGDQTNITITVRDQYENGVEGAAENISVSITGANDGASVEPITDDGNGRYSTGYTPISNGTDQVVIEFNGTEIQGSPYSSTVITSDAEFAVIQQQPQQTVAGEPIPGPPSVYVTDDQDNPVEGVEVIASLQGSATFAGGTTTVSTESNGVAQFDDLRINTTGSYTIEFNAVGVSDDVVSESFTVVAAGPDELRRVSGNNQQDVVTTELNPFTVRVVDEFENPVSGVSVDFEISDTPGGANGQELSSTSVSTGSNGEASATLTLGDVVGVYSVLASAGSAGTTTFSATATAGTAASFNFETISSPQTAGDPFEISISAEDEFGNLASGYNGTASLSAASGSVTPSIISFSDGTASGNVELNTAGNNQSITATDGSITGTSNEFNVESGGVDADNSNVNASPGSVEAGGSSLITIELRDGINNPVSGLEEDITLNVSGNGSADAVSEDGTSGNYTSNVTNTTAETVTVSVSVNGINIGDDSIQFTPADAESIEIVSGDDQNGSVNEQLPENFVVRVTDEYSNEVSGESVSFSITDTPGGSDGSLSTNTDQTSPEGIASTRFTLGDTPGEYIVAASVSGVGSVNFSAIAQIGSASQMSIITQPSNTTAGDAITPAPQVEVTDAAGNPVEGVDVTVSEQGGAEFDSGSTSQSTNSSGIATFSGLMFETADSYRLVFNASASGVSNVQSGSFNIVAAAGEPANSTADVPNGAAGEETNITIAIEDEFGNPVTGAEDVLSVSVTEGANSGATFSSVTDNGNGSYSTSYTPQNNGTDQIAIELNGSGISGSPFESNVSTSDVSSSNSSASADPTNLPAGNNSTVTLLIRDGSNNVIGGLSNSDFNINVSGSGSASSVSETTTSGTYEFTVTNEDAEQVTVTVTATGTTLDDEPQIQFTAADPDLMAITVQPEETEAGQFINGPPSVRITDEFNNTVPNIDVNVSEQGGESFTSGSTTTVSTNNSGIAVFDELSIETTGQYNLVFSSGGVSSQTSNAFNVTAASADASETTADVPNGAAGDRTQITITVRDAFSNPVEGASAELSVSVGGANSGSSTDPISEEGNGVYTTGYIPESNGTDQITIQLNGTAIQGSPFTSEVTTSEASVIEIEQQPGETVAGATIQGPPSVLVTDNFGNPVGNIEVVASIEGSATFDSGTATVTTSAQGIAVFNDLVIETVDTYTMRFNAIGVSDDVVSAPFNVVAAVPAEINIESGNSQSGEVLQELTDPFVVRLTDQFDNPIVDESVSFSITEEPSGANGQSLSSTSVQTDESGEAFTTLTLGDTPGNYEVEASVSGLTPVVFSATATAGSAASFNFENISSPQVAGEPFPISITAVDTEGNTATGYNETANLSAVSGSVSPSTISFTNGTASGNVELNTPGTNQTITATDGSISGTSNEFDVESGGVDTDNSSVSASPTSLQAGENSTVTIELRDGSNNPVSGLADDINVDVSGDGTAGEVSESGSTGNYTSTISNTTAETVTVSASVNGENVGEDTIEFTVADADDIAIFSGNNQTGSVSQELSEDFMVRVTDTFDNEISGETVFFSVTTNAGGSDGSLSNDNVLTGPNGLASTRFTLGDTPGDYTVTASLTGGVSVDFTATATAGSASFFNFATISSPQTAGEPFEITITAEDGSGNTSTGYNGSSTLTTTAGAITPGTADFTNGTATLNVDVSESGGGETISTVDGSISGTSNEFDVDAAAGDPSSTTADVPDGTVGESTTITITVKDAFGNSVEGAAGDLSVEVSGDNSATPTVTETVGGEYEASYIPTNSGTDAIGISLDGNEISGSPYTSNVSAGSASDLIISTQPGTSTAGESIAGPPSVRVTDSEGNEISGINVTAILSSNDFTPASTTTEPTNQDGLAVFENLVIDTAETGYSIIFDADAAGVADVTSGLFDVTAAAAESVTIESGDEQTGSINEELSEDFVVRVADTFDNEISGETVFFSVTTNAGGSDGSLSNGEVSTGPNGLASTRFTLGDTPGDYIVTASLTGGVSVNFTATATAGSASIFNFATISSPQTVGEPFEITITAEDGSGNTSTGYNGSAMLTTTAGTIDPGSALFTDGVATVSVSVTEAGTGQTITADDGSISATSAGFDVNPGTVSASASSASATSPHTADGTNASTVTILLRDNFGNEISGLAPGDFIVDVEDASSGPVSETSTNGTYTFEVTHDTAEEITVQVAADGVPLDDTPTIVFEATGPPEMEITEQPTDTQAGESIAPAPSVRLLDAGGDPVTGADITATLSSNSFSGTSDATATTDGSGDAIFDNLAIDTATDGYTITFDADLADVEDITSTSFDVTPSGVSASASSASATSPHAADGADASTVTITLQDSFGNEISGLGSGDFSVDVEDASDGAISETTPATYAFEVTHETAEEITVQVTADGVLLEDTPTIVFEATDPPEMTITEQPTQTQAGESIAPAPTVRLLDAGGDPVTGVDITATLSSNSFSGTSNVTVPTDGSGHAVFTNLSIDTATSGYTITFDADLAEVGNVTSISFDVTPAGISASVSGVGATSPHDADGVDASVVTVELQDSFGNEITGLGPGDFSIDVESASNGPISETSPATYAFEVTHETAEEITVQVTADGVSLEDTPTIVFEATGPPEMTITEQPTETQAGESIAPAPTVRLLDAGGDPVTGVDITATLNSNDFSGTSNATVSTDGSGDAVFNNLAIETAGADYTITFDADAPDVGDVTSDQFDVTVSAPASVTASVVSGTAAADGSDELEFSVTVEDEFENPVSGVTVMASDDGSGIGYTDGGDSQQTDELGQVTFTASSTTAQPNVTFTFTEQVNNNQVTAAGSFEDNSEFTLVDPGDQATDEEFTLEITDARAVNGDPLDGSANVRVTSSEDGQVHNESVIFSSGAVGVPITLSAAAIHTLLVEVAGIDSDETIDVTVQTNS